MTAGSPRIDIDKETVEKLSSMQCTIEEIAGWFDCSVDTIENRVKEWGYKNFSEYFSIKRSKGKISLRRKQYETAMSGNPTMLIWLGKQYLKQRDKKEVDLNETPNKTLTLNYNLNKDEE